MEKLILISVILFSSFISIAQTNDSLKLKAEIKPLIDNTQLVIHPSNDTFCSSEDHKLLKVGSTKSKTTAVERKRIDSHNSSAAFRRRNSF